MATVLDRVPVDRIAAEARELHPGRTLLTVLAASLFALGWLAGRTVSVAWAACAWCLAAIKVGWADALHRPDGGG